MSIDLLPDETILPDDYPVYGDYLYIADGNLYRCEWHGETVAHIKRREGFKEVRRCSSKRVIGTAQEQGK